MGVQGLALLALLCAAGTEPRNESHALVAGRRRLSDQYAQIAKLVAGDAAQSDQFGGSVAIDGNTVIIGATGAGTGGAVYILRTSDGGATYVEVAKLTASDAATSDRFGLSVAIAGDTIVVGASGDDDAGSSSGAVYVFRTSDGGATYAEVAKLTAADAAANDYFGKVAIDGDTIVVGASGGTGGAVYIFSTTDGWTTHTEIKLTVADAAQWDYFGYSVAIAGDTVVVGAYGKDDDMGAVYKEYEMRAAIGQELADKDKDRNGVVIPEESAYKLTSARKLLEEDEPAPAPAPSPPASPPSPLISIALDEPVLAALAAAGLDPDELRPYAADTPLRDHPFLEKLLQDAGITEVGARFKTIKALSGTAAAAPVL